jgi:polygalacturonase
MIKRLGLLLAVSAVAGVLGGCGSTNTVTVTTGNLATTPTGATTTPTGATTTPATTTPAATTPTGTTTTPATASGPTSAEIKAAEAANPALKAELAQAVASCKSSVNAAPTLNASDKSKLDSICAQAASGDTAGVQKATSEVCQQIIRDSVPASAQAQALASCPKP